MRYEKGFIISNFSRFVLGDDKAVTKNKRQSPGFHPARTRDTKPNCSRLQGQRNCKFPPYERKTIQEWESNILRKTNLPDISSAIQYALEKGLLGITYA